MFRLTHPLMQEAAGDAGAAGAGAAGGDAAGNAGGDAAGNAGAADNAAGDTGDKGKPDSNPGLPTADDWKKAQETIAALNADLEDRKKAEQEAADKAEEERKSSLSETERIKEEMAALKSNLEEEKVKLVQGRRELALGKLGVAQKFRAYAPDVDPATAEGQKALDDWAKANPELLVKSSGGSTGGVVLTLPEAGNLAKIAAGKLINPLVPIDSIRKIGS